MKIGQMLRMYREAAAPNMQAVAEEFLALSPSEQRELLFWMVVDASTNPTNVRQADGRDPRNA